MLVLPALWLGRDGTQWNRGSPGPRPCFCSVPPARERSFRADRLLYGRPTSRARSAAECPPSCATKPMSHQQTAACAWQASRRPRAPDFDTARFAWPRPAADQLHVRLGAVPPKSC
eukprot:scaffold6685_cov202-Prasinococcus_capsulatus_cf.AAC.13